jgi:hypothetical protein
MPNRLAKVWTTRLRRIAVATLIIAFVIGSIGFPVVRRPLKDRSQPFPCQDSVCGCQSAEDCWRHCCCRTNREKLAWAAEHRVTPPRYVVKAALAEKEPAAKETTCCSHNCQEVATCESAGSKIEGSGIKAKNRCHEAESSDDHDGVEVVLVLSDLARKCRGLSPLWSVLNCAVVSTPPVRWSFDWTIVGTVVEAPIRQQLVELPPPVPPPKLFPTATA